MDILNQVSRFQKLYNSKITILGGTGFVGTWLINAIDSINGEWDSRISIELYTRDSRKAQKKFEGLKFTLITYTELNLSSKVNIKLNSSDYFIHGATPSVVRTGFSNKDLVYKSTVNSAMLIKLAMERSPYKSVAMHLSSGAVYGSQSLEVKLQPEIEIGPIKSGLSTYARAKIEAETYIQELNSSKLLIGLNPRLFTFYGPGIALDEHFAVGNFMGNILKKEMVLIKGNSSTVRSYLYPTDLTIWLLTILARPILGPINIGSEKPITILELARNMNSILGGIGVHQSQIEAEATNYVPAVESIRVNYELKQEVELEDGLIRWKNWLESKNFTA